MEYGGSAEDIARTCHGHPTLSGARSVGREGRGTRHVGAGGGSLRTLFSAQTLTRSYPSLASAAEAVKEAALATAFGKPIHM